MPWGLLIPGLDKHVPIEMTRNDSNQTTLNATSRHGGVAAVLWGLSNVWAPFPSPGGWIQPPFRRKKRSAHVMVLWWWLERWLAGNSVAFGQCLLFFLRPFLQELHQSVWKAPALFLHLSSTTPQVTNKLQHKGDNPSFLRWEPCSETQPVYITTFHKKKKKNSKPWVYMATKLFALKQKYGHVSQGH